MATKYNESSQLSCNSDDSSITSRDFQEQTTSNDEDTAKQSSLTMEDKVFVNVLLNEHKNKIIRVK